eukprot:jgi/Hompol1/5240/HPOL_004273-RA
MRVTSGIQNKLKREEVYHKLKSEKAREKLQTRMKRRKEEAANPELKKERLETNVPKTLENLREADETLVGEDEEVRKGSTHSLYLGCVADDEPCGLENASQAIKDCGPSFVGHVFADEDTDEFAGYFNTGIPPKILITTSKHALTMIHLPHGPTFTFKLTSIKLNKQIRGHAKNKQLYKPELILNNFSTRLGHTVGRMFAALFPQVPEFKGRQVATFHNQRDFIFFRRHRYIFRNGQRCDIQEMGPRFTLKLMSLQKGTFDTKFGEYEWVHKPELDTSRHKFHL